MASSAFRTTFFRRLAVAYGLSALFSLVLFYGFGIDSIYFFLDPLAIFLAFATGMIATVASTWYLLLPPPHLPPAWITFAAILAVCGAVVRIDLSRRDEWDALITVIVVMPQLFTIIVTTFVCAIIDTRKRA